MIYNVLLSIFLAGGEGILLLPRITIHISIEKSNIRHTILSATKSSMGTQQTRKACK